MSTGAAIAIGLISPLVALMLVVAATWLLTVLSPDEDENRRRKLIIVFPAGALVGGAALAAGNALLTWIDGGPVALATLAGAAAGVVSAPLLLAGLLVGFYTTVSLLLPFFADVGALLLVSVQ